jgi:hypothetical protein
MTGQPMNHSPQPDESLALTLEALQGRRGDHQRRIARTAIEWAATLLRKNVDYGSSAWKEPVLAPGLPTGVAIMVRASDKIERIRSLLQRSNGPQFADESLADTIADLGAYMLLWLARPTADATKAPGEPIEGGLDR